MDMMEKPGIHIRPPRPPRRLTPQDPSLSPEAHFPLQTVASPDRTPFPRFINRFDSREILLAVDGSCVNNGRHVGLGCEGVAEAWSPRWWW